MDRGIIADNASETTSLLPVTRAEHIATTDYATVDTHSNAVRRDRSGIVGTEDRPPKQNIVGKAAVKLDTLSLRLYRSSQFFFLAGCLINDYVVVGYYNSGGQQSYFMQLLNVFAYFLWVLNPLSDLFFAMRTQKHVLTRDEVADKVERGEAWPRSALAIGASKQKKGLFSGNRCRGTNLFLPVAFVISSILYMVAVALPIHCSGSTTAGMDMCDPNVVNLVNFAAAVIMFCGAMSSCVNCLSVACCRTLSLRQRVHQLVSQAYAVMCFTRKALLEHEVPTADTSKLSSAVEANYPGNATNILVRGAMQFFVEPSSLQEFEKWYYLCLDCHHILFRRHT